MTTMMMLRRLFRICVVILVLIVSTRAASAASGSGSGSGSGSDSHDPEHFLYSEGDDTEPVMDYHGRDAHGRRDADIGKPAFIFGPNTGPRMVEFYAYWCPHCRHFRDHFVQLARQVTTVAAEQGVDITVHAVSCTEYRELCNHFDVDGYPKIKLFHANATDPSSSVNYWEAHPFEVLNELGVHPTKALQFDKSAALRHGGKSDTSIVRRSKSDVFNDAHLSFDFALRNGIYMTTGALTNSTRDALWDWLQLLRQSLPPTWEIQNLLHGLIKEFDQIIKSEDNLIKVVERYPLPKKTWSEACSKGEKGMGYTCGLWELFHIMSVGVVEWNLMIYDGDHLILPVDDPAVTLRDYIENFFGCEVCRMNFIHAFDSCAHDRCSRLHHDGTTQKEWVQLPLWLFETHNSVNLRLMRERAEREKWTTTREDELKAEWPSRRDCPKCWREDGGWHEDMVYKHLRVEYWLDDAIADVYRKELAEVEIADDDETSMPSLALQLFPLMLVLGMGVAWYMKEREKRKTGRHKRIA